jgi:hypothetical protein
VAGIRRALLLEYVAPGGRDARQVDVGDLSCASTRLDGEHEAQDHLGLWFCHDGQHLAFVLLAWGANATIGWPRHETAYLPPLP